MNYTLPSGREVTSEVLLKIERENMPGLPIACKVCPAALWQLTGKPNAPQPRCFCRVMHVFTWPSQQDEILDCDLIYISEAQTEAKQEQREQKLTEKEEREQKKALEKAEMEQRQRDRETRRQQREQREDQIREERTAQQNLRRDERMQESAQKTERARLRAQKKKGQKTETEVTPATAAEPSSADLPLTPLIPPIPEAGSHSDLPAFQDWANQTPPYASEEDSDQDD